MQPLIDIQHLRKDTMIKLVVMIKRKPGMPKEDFHRYWSVPTQSKSSGAPISNDTSDDMYNRM